MTPAQKRREAAIRNAIADALAWQGLHCAGCGSAKIVSVSPGSDTDADLFVTARPGPDRAWCERCAVSRGWLTPHIERVAA